MTQLPCIAPVAHDQRPDSLMPPSAGRARGAGARKGRVANASLLSLLAEQRHHPVVQRVEAERPGARGASVGHPPHRVEDRLPRCLYAAVAGGHEQFVQVSVQCLALTNDDIICDSRSRGAMPDMSPKWLRSSSRNSLHAAMSVAR